MVEANVPLLAMPSGSILQFLLMTVPLLCVYLYFLFLAYKRPSIANPDNPRYADDRIRLMDILYTYLATLALFSCLVVYMLWFVPKRRGLSTRYKTDGIIILGHVNYTESSYDRNKVVADTDGGGMARRALRGVKNCCLQLHGWAANGFALRNNYAHVVYDLSRVANHPACTYEDRKGRQLEGIITKKVRVYHFYPREQVSILVLPKYPYSGQPKADMEADWASFTKYVGLPSQEDETESEREENALLKRRDRSCGVVFVAIFWVCFLLLASLYVVYRIEEVDDAYNDEDAKMAWWAFWYVIGAVVPVVAFGGNWMRWKIYERWMLHKGSKKSKTRENEREDEGASYIQMS